IDAVDAAQQRRRSGGKISSRYQARIKQEQGTMELCDRPAAGPPTCLQIVADSAAVGRNRSTRLRSLRELHRTLRPNFSKSRAACQRRKRNARCEPHEAAAVDHALSSLNLRAEAVARRSTLCLVSERSAMTAAPKGAVAAEWSGGRGQRQGRRLRPFDDP